MRYLDEFVNFVTSVCGVYWMSIGGYRSSVNEMNEVQEKQIRQLTIKSPSNANMEFVDSLPCMYCEGDPNLPGAVVLYSCTQKEYKEINRENGSNWDFIWKNVCDYNISVLGRLFPWRDSHTIRSKKRQNRFRYNG